MKKSLLALSVLAAAAASAHAQSNVSIYGIVDSGISYSDNGSGSKLTTLGSGVQSGNRLGFRGTEDLGGGKKALFTLENGFNINNGSVGQSTTDMTRIYGRQAFVGLSDNTMGEVRFGRQYNPIRPALESVNPFEIGLAGNILSIFDAHGERSDNAVTYSSPKIGGFSGQALYNLGQATGNTSFGRQRGLSVNYANGPVYVIAAYHNSDLVGGTTAIPTDIGSKKTTMLGGVYDFKFLKAHVAYAWNKGESVSSVDNLDTRDMMLGVTVPVGGAGKFLASFMRKKNEMTANADTKQWSLGYTYDLSKRTDLYASYAKITNDANVKLAPFSTVGTIVNGADPSTFNVGIRHKF